MSNEEESDSSTESLWKRWTPGKDALHLNKFCAFYPLDPLSESSEKTDGKGQDDPPKNQDGLVDSHTRPDIAYLSGVPRLALRHTPTLIVTGAFLFSVALPSAFEYFDSTGSGYEVLGLADWSVLAFSGFSLLLLVALASGIQYLVKKCDATSKACTSLPEPPGSNSSNGITTFLWISFRVLFLIVWGLLFAGLLATDAIKFASLFFASIKLELQQVVIPVVGTGIVVLFLLMLVVFEDIFSVEERGSVWMELASAILFYTVLAWLVVGTIGKLFWAVSTSKTASVEPMLGVRDTFSDSLVQSNSSLTNATSITEIVTPCTAVRQCNFGAQWVHLEPLEPVGGGYLLLLLIGGLLVYDGMLKTESLFWNLGKRNVIENKGRYEDFHEDLQDSLEGETLGDIIHGFLTRFSLGGALPDWVLFAEARQSRAFSTTLHFIWPPYWKLSIVFSVLFTGFFTVLGAGGPTTLLALLAAGNWETLLLHSVGPTFFFNVFLVLVAFQFLKLIKHFHALITDDGDDEEPMLAYNPFHHDGRGGFRDLGKFATRVNMLLILGGLYLAYRFIVASAASGTTIQPVSIGALLAYAVATGSWLYYSFWMMHRRMKRGREEWLATINTPTQWNEVRNAPVWPVSSRELLSLVTANLVPFVLLVRQIL